MSNSRIILYSIFLATLLALMVLWISSVLPHGEGNCDDGWRVSHGDSCDRTNLYREQNISEHADQRHFHCYLQGDRRYGVVFAEQHYPDEDFGSPCQPDRAVADSGETESEDGECRVPELRRKLLLELQADGTFIVIETYPTYRENTVQFCLGQYKAEVGLGETVYLDFWCGHWNDHWSSRCCARITEYMDWLKSKPASAPAVRRGKLVLSWAELKRGI